MAFRNIEIDDVTKAQAAKIEAIRALVGELVIRAHDFDHLPKNSVQVVIEKPAGEAFILVGARGAVSRSHSAMYIGDSQTDLDDNNLSALEAL